MTRKSEAAYVELVGVMRTYTNNLRVRYVMADYEAALRNAVRRIYPNVVLRGCWFHFAKAVYLRARASQLVGHDAAVPNAVQAVQMAMALPLLPQALYERGVDQVEGTLGMAGPFIAYLRNYWGRRGVSVYRADCRTNNLVESLHRQLNSFVGRQHPNFWALLTDLQRMENLKASDFVRFRLGRDGPRQRPERNVRLNRRIGKK